MNLTIKQILQKGISAHKDGKIQEAERLYRIILKAQPSHPDANHNLGVLAVSVNKTDVALPLFKTALEANPEIEQFWLSYINALIKEEQFEKAKETLEKAKSNGLAEEKVNILDARLTPVSKLEDSKSVSQKKPLKFSEKRKKLAEEKKKNKKNKKASSASPHQVQINNLLKIYQKGNLNEAERLAKSLTKEFPKHQFGWKVLGAVLQQTGRIEDSLVASQKSLQIAPKDFEAHNNLSNILRELGRLNEAVISYKKSIALKPDYAEAYSNLGVTLYELSKLEEAEVSQKKAIALKPNFVEAHSNLGDTLKALGRLEEAIKSYREALKLRPSYIEAHNNLLRCLYLMDQKSSLFNELDILINQDKANALIGSITCRSSLKYGLEKQNLFCNEPLKYVLHTDLNTECDFDEIFIKTSRSILDKEEILNKEQSLLINGYQTSGNLFERESSLTDKIQKIIHYEIEKYLNNFKNSEEGLIKKWSNEYRLNSWLISMKSGGQIKPHIHEYGWLSGSIYINVPPKVNTDSGNLVISIGEEKDTEDESKNLKKIINVVTGSLVLFPASLTHYTIPFKAEEERIVLAFDVIPKR